ncbi:NTP pyrophosphohydrolase [Roseivivax halodurans JCM 10272]|uniref:NTP pyrophosphohydrolase n=1 Tax=Roseivivax halodurans JCM 10272 TaxID=1449350 RepID=X7EGF2_9RHOB|nr:NUDIX hydrolase [Roseivivax halodurans]ETX14925.1 NTP pyrophosphohydrolase [Roseivivax halodurans JCM 10272]
MLDTQCKCLDEQQIAALPLRRSKKHGLEVLMVTSRDTKRWVMPKGWPMDGKKLWSAAEIEALEEAGATGFVGKVPIGAYHYVKRMGGKPDIACHVTVYPMVVEKLKKRWKERKERTRRWFDLRSAAKRVDEPDLVQLLLKLHSDKDFLPAKFAKRI